MFDEKKHELNVGGKTVKISTGKIARQASSVMVECGGTTILTTVTRSPEAKEGSDFFPLTVDYVEKFYASGKFPGGFIKREARPSTDATLIARLLDRPIRPLFPKGFNYSVHVVVTVLSFDGENLPENLAPIGVSAALSISDLPFLGPVGGLTVGYIDGEYIVNPTPEQLKISQIELSVAGTEEAIMMVEAGANEVTEKEMLDAVLFGHEKIKVMCEDQKAFINMINPEKMEFIAPEINGEVKSFVDEFATSRLKEAINIPGKHERADKISELKEELTEKFASKYDENVIPDDLASEFSKYYDSLMKELVRNEILYDKKRPDGRNTTEIRAIDVEVDILKMTHGSALFTRGETQALVVTTLGSKEDEQIVDGLSDESRKKFYLHYNFPPYSVGEAGFMRAPGRREIGHGNLAERALKYVMPEVEEFPYTVRLVSEITESNGSSSQASICGGSLALMASGVPIRRPVSGIAMGLIKEGEEFVVLSDIQGLEDHLGDMDFKVAGTEKGITALQMDIKITGITKEIMEISLKQAHEGRMHILEKMNSVINESRKEVSEYAPKIHFMKIDPDKIAILIGPGGKVIKGIIDQTGATIDIEDDGSVAIFTARKEDLDRTIALVNEQIVDVEEGKVYKGKVTKLAKFGAFVEVLPGKEGLLHVSELRHERVAKVEDVLEVGQEVEVKVLNIENGKYTLSMKALLPKPEKE